MAKKQVKKDFEVETQVILYPVNPIIVEAETQGGQVEAGRR